MDKEIKFTKEELTSADIISEASVTIEKMITEAYAEAIKRNIKANTIVINKNLVEVKPFVIKYSNGFQELPPMICGLEAHFTDNELPDGYAFSILEAQCTEREFLVQQTRENSVREFAKELKSIYEELDNDVEIPVRLIREDIDAVLKALIGE